MQTVKDRVTSLEKEDGELTDNDQETANLLASYFQEVFTTEDLTSIPKVIAKDLQWKDSNLNFSEEIVRLKLMKLQVEKSPGPDEIHKKLLNMCSAEIARPLSMIFQKSYGQYCTDLQKREKSRQG